MRLHCRKQGPIPNESRKREEICNGEIFYKTAEAAIETPLESLEAAYEKIRDPRKASKLSAFAWIYTIERRMAATPFGFSLLRRSRRYVRHDHPLLPNTVLANSDRRMIALALNGTAALNLPSHAPFSIFPHFIAICTYGVRGIRLRIVVHRAVVAEMHILEHIFIMFLDGLPTVHWS